MIDPKNAVAFFGKRNLWPNTASKLGVQILTYVKEYVPFCPPNFSLSSAQILRLSRKIKTKCIFRVTQHLDKDIHYIRIQLFSLLQDEFIHRHLTRHGLTIRPGIDQGIECVNHRQYPPLHRDILAG